MMADPIVETIGLIDNRDDAEMEIEDRIYDEVLDVFDHLSKKIRTDDEALANELRIAVRGMCRQLLGLRPNTTVHVLRV